LINIIITVIIVFPITDIFVGTKCHEMYSSFQWMIHRVGNFRFRSRASVLKVNFCKIVRFILAKIEPVLKKIVPNMDVVCFWHNGTNDRFLWTQRAIQWCCMNCIGYFASNEMKR
jgi:hypothetical protein